MGKENQKIEITRRTRLAWAAFGKLSYILKNEKIPLYMRRRIFDQCILPVLTYGVQVWTFTKHNIDRLAKTQRSMERSMLHITLKDRMRNEWIRQRTGVEDVVKHASQLKWKWAGHNARYDDNRWNYIIQQWRPWTRKRRRGRPQLRWADDIKKVAGPDWMKKARDRNKWRETEEAYVQYWNERG